MALARRQFYVISRAQLLELGATTAMIAHRLRTGRLHRLLPGVYSVGRPDPGYLGNLMAVVLYAGPGAFISHGSAAALWRIARFPSVPIHVSIPNDRAVRSRKLLVVHRRTASLLVPPRVGFHRGIPATSPAETIIDIALGLTVDELDAAISEADKLDLIDPDAIRAAAAGDPHRHGAGRVRRAIDRHEFVLSDSRLERLFVPLALRAGAGKPVTRSYRNSHRVDFWFEELGLVVETDGLRYHRTAAQQSKDLKRDQDHAAAGQERLRFSHWQVAHEPGRVADVLSAVARRLAAGRR